jgi:hypothetical protein
MTNWAAVLHPGQITDEYARQVEREALQAEKDTFRARYMVAWTNPEHRFTYEVEDPDGSVRQVPGVIDNAEIRTRMLKIAAYHDATRAANWHDEPTAGYPDPLEAKFKAHAVAESSGIGTVSPGGPDPTFLDMMARRRALEESWGR